MPNLRQVRQRRLLTQAELAQRAGISETEISRIETGHHKARISTVRKLCAALGVEADALLTPPRPATTAPGADS